MEPLVVANPIAGAGRTRGRIREIEPVLRGWPAPPIVRWTRASGDAMGLARWARDQGCPLVIAAGGDGTAHEVVNGLLADGGDQGGTEFAYLPTGTGCDFARSLGLPLEPERLARELPGGDTVGVDVGRAELRGPDGTRVVYFLNAVNVGLGPAVAERVRGSVLLRRLGGSAYLLASAIEILGARPLEVRVSYDGEIAADGPVLNMSICNGASFGGGMRPCPDADLRSGRLEVAHIGPMSKLDAFRQLPLLMKGGGTHHPAVRYRSCRRLRLDGTEAAVEVDGEVPGTLPARIAVIAGGLRLRWPL